MPIISVIVPVYNGADTLAATLTALAHQVCCVTYEVIVVDNGSTDGSVCVAKAFQSEFQNYRVVIADARKGAAYARNAGAGLARGRWLVFMDADDVPARDWLASMASGLEQHRFVASRHDGRKLNSPVLLRARGCPQSEGLQEYDYPKFLPHSGGCGLGVHKDLHEQLGGFDESWQMLEDTEYCWRLQLHRVKLVFLSDALVHIRMRTDTRSTVGQAFRWGSHNVRLYKRFRKHMPKIPWKKGIRWWLYFLGPRYMLNQLSDPETRPRWVWLIHWRLGRIVGSLRYRVWAL
ncbi:MAG: glycosyltransferase family A protein [Pseudomonadota bacterium]